MKKSQIKPKEYLKDLNSILDLVDKIDKLAPEVTDLKQFYHCDTVFKAQGCLWICNKIEDVSYEEIKN